MPIFQSVTRSGQSARSSRVGVALSLLLGLCFSGMSLAADPAIGGYSPISYHTKGIAELGHPDFNYVHNDQLYYFASEEQVALFAADPEKYLPKYGANCPYSLALGKAVPIDPTNFKVVGGVLLLFHQSEDTNNRELFEQHTDQEGLIQEADSQFTLLDF